MEVFKGIGRLFYIISPFETVVENVDEVPDYVYAKGIPFYFTFILIEFIIQFFKNKNKARLNDSIVSLSNGIYYGCAKALIRGVEVYAYMQIYSYWRFTDLPWDSPFTWYIGALCVDFVYYWIHRASHEINFLWGAHQVHHSSEDFNLTVALRHSSIQGLFNWIFYLPLALAVPPAIFLIHQQFNLMFQFWIHTEIVESVGPLEYILNTPKHHRIHHGSNRYCLDKNYGGVLIIWDRIFGTFAEEKPNEKIVYGLVNHIYSFNPFLLQFYYFPLLWKRMSEYSNVGDKLSVIFKGPSWEPGKPRLGIDEDKILYPIREIHNVVIPLWQNLYIVLHFALICYGFDALMKQTLDLNPIMVIISVVYILSSLTCLGFILENRSIAHITEIGRCVIGIIIVTLIFEINSYERKLLSNFFSASICIWAIMGLFDSFSIQFVAQKIVHVLKSLHFHHGEKID